MTTIVWRHVKRGSLYVVLGIGELQASAQLPPVEGDNITVYVGLDDGKTWARPSVEFDDGRFEPVGNDPSSGIQALAELLVMRAAEQGLVLTIEQTPLHPLAMGNYATQVSVRPARGKANG